MKDVRVPGVVWALALIVVVALIHENQEQLPFSPAVIDAVVLGFIAIIKSIALGDEQLQRALDVIERIVTSGGSMRERGSADSPAGISATGVPVAALAADAPERPNRFVRWMVG